jgi:hypothetical protein
MLKQKTDRFKNSDATCDLIIQFDDEAGILHVKWSGEISFRKLKRGYQMALDYSRTYQANKWLLDLSERTVLPEGFHPWITTVFFPKILRSNKRNCFVAGVLPVNYYSSVQDKFDSSELVAENNLLLFNHFLLPETGLRWLKSLS